jgi:hypothetical protein
MELHGAIDHLSVERGYPYLENAGGERFAKVVGDLRPFSVHGGAFYTLWKNRPRKVERRYGQKSEHTLPGKKSA